MMMMITNAADDDDNNDHDDEHHGDVGTGDEAGRSIRIRHRQLHSHRSGWNNGGLQKLRYQKQTRPQTAVYLPTIEKRTTRDVFRLVAAMTRAGGYGAMAFQVRHIGRPRDQQC